LGFLFSSFSRYVFALVLCGFPLLLQAKTEQINSLRLWHSPDSTRIVFDVSSDISYQSFTLEKPFRLVVDLEDTHLKATLPELQVDNRHIAAVRTGKPKLKTLRFVFELKQELQHKSFVLTPNELYGHRLVVDLMEQPNAPTPVVEDSISETSSVSETTSLAPLEQQQPRKLIVAIDAGHGGEDPGAIGYRGSHEKKITLSIAKKLKKIIDQNPNMQANLIRTGDYFIKLHKRRMNARHLNADMFISIHADAFIKKSANGFSVFALSQRGATSAMARALAAQENAADLIGGVSLADKDQVLAQVLVDLSMTNTISESVNFGGRVLKELGKLGRLHSKRVEQAGFAVLKSPDMPSILVETGFITNPQDEKNLRSSNYQNKIAKAIYTAIDGYYQQTPHFTNARYASPNVNSHSNSGSASKRNSKPLIHVVKRGDSLSKISVQYNVTIAAIKRLNNFKRDTVYLGQKVKLPSGAKGKKKPAYHTVRRGDTLSKIAEKYDVAMKQIVQLNKLKSRKILLGQRLKIPN